MPHLEVEATPAKSDRNTVDTPSSWIEADEERHQLAAALRIGTQAMKAAASRWEWMRPNPGELEIVPLGAVDNATISGPGLTGHSPTGEFTVYDLRVDRSCMPNAWRGAILDTARLPFRKRIKLEGWDPELMGVDTQDEDGTVTNRIPGWVDDIDGEGQTFDEWAAGGFEDSLFDGIIYGFVDQDDREFPDPASRAAAGARPYVTKLSRGDLVRITIGRSETGVPRILQLVFKQPLTETDVADPNDWKETVTEAVKVVTAGELLHEDPEQPERITGHIPIITRIYTKEEGEDDFVEREDLAGTITPENPDDARRFLDVPLFPLYGDRISPWRGQSPYLDSAHTQACVWNHVSEMLEKARSTSLAYLHESGVQVEKAGGEATDAEPVQLDNHSLRYRWSTDAAARLSFAEQSGESLKALREVIEWLINVIEKAHHQINADRPTGPVTAREITLEGVHASSALEMMVIFQEAGWKQILDAMAILGGHQQLGTVSIPHDFGLPNTGMERNHSLFLGGNMHPKNYWREAQRNADVHETEFDLEAELELFEQTRLAEFDSAAPDLLARLDGAAQSPVEEPGAEEDESEPAP